MDDWIVVIMVVMFVGIGVDVFGKYFLDCIFDVGIVE